MAGRPRLLSQNLESNADLETMACSSFEAEMKSTGVAGHVFKSFRLCLNRIFIRSQTVTSTQLAPSFCEPGRANHSLYKDPSSLRRISSRPREIRDFTVPILI
jgi:hypothetical protein